MFTKISELVEQFNNEIIYDAHGTSTKVTRSEACKKLFEEGEEIIPELILYLQNNPPDEYVSEAWIILFYRWLSDDELNPKLEKKFQLEELDEPKKENSNTENLKIMLDWIEEKL